MATKLVWTIGASEYTLTNDLLVPMDRFADWTPLAMGIGPRPHQLSNGQPRKWVHRYDYRARFRLEHIPMAFHGLCMSLQQHLEDGGTVFVHTGDVDSHIYECYLAPEATVDVIAQEDRQLIWYSMSFDLLNAAVDPEPMLASYDEAVEQIT